MDFQGFRLNNKLEAVGQLTDPKTCSLKSILTSKNSGGGTTNHYYIKTLSNNTVLLYINTFC